MELNDWWERMLYEHRLKAAKDAREGYFELPYPVDDDPQNQDENHAYATEWKEERRRLGDAFRWAG